MSTEFLIEKAQDAQSGALLTSVSLNVSTAEIARPADVLAYAVGDSVNTSTTVPTVMTFTNMGLGLRDEGYIVKAQLATDQATCVAQFRLWLFSSPTPFLSNDNAAFLLKYADRTTRLGYIDFPALTTETGSDCAVSLVSNIKLPYVSATTNEIYGVLETKTVFTPASGQHFFVALTGEQS